MTNKNDKTWQNKCLNNDKNDKNYKSKYINAKHDKK